MLDTKVYWQRIWYAIYFCFKKPKLEINLVILDKKLNSKWVKLHKSCHWFKLNLFFYFSQGLSGDFPQFLSIELPQGFIIDLTTEECCVYNLLIILFPVIIESFLAKLWSLSSTIDYLLDSDWFESWDYISFRSPIFFTAFFGLLLWVKNGCIVFLFLSLT